MTSLPAPVQTLLTLFQGPLANVRFADVDAAALRQLADEIDRASVEAEEQEQRLAGLRHALAQQHESMLALAQRALAYARVYAEGDEELTQELNRISLARPVKPRKTGAAKPSDALADDGVKPARAEAAVKSPSSVALAAEGEARDADSDETTEREASFDAELSSESELGLGEQENAAPAPRKKKPRGRGESITTDR